MIESERSKNHLALGVNVGGVVIRSGSNVSCTRRGVFSDILRVGALKIVGPAKKGRNRRMIDDPLMKKLLEEQEMESGRELLPPVPAVDPSVLRQKISGAAIGGGTSRTVYPCLDSDRVIKESKQAFPGANLTEHYIWTNVRQSPKWKEVFGEVFSISTDGRLIEMEHLEDLAPSDYTDLPDFPDFVQDPKRDNFGKDKNGKIKIRDYGICNIDSLLNSADPNKGAVNALRKKPK